MQNMAQKRPMLLLIDAGNTRVKWACVALDAALQFPADWELIGSSSNQDYAQMLAAISPCAIARCMISNVAGNNVQQELERVLQDQFPDLHIERFTSQAQCAGLHNRYRDVSKLGSDRFAAAIAAHRQFPELPLVVATCGTATTVDAVTAEGLFLGGMILPGLQLMASSLANNTAQLPQITAGAELPSLFADNTDQAIASGCIHAQLGAILCAVQSLARHVENKSAEPIQVIISGGAATYLLPQLKQSDQMHWHHFDNLVLSGLWIAASSSQSSFH
ncbi:type III pantothenate kinase [Undibacterium sp.]|uniref:type III pantothenate kinase n=1 Tax=Undibacterium sp. TaxID=1914977 RepID=UPI0037507DA1